ncbi:MAG: TipAS antibiotic-recognition domain-containing protein [Salinivirgaceae bacterium]
MTVFHFPPSDPQAKVYIGLGALYINDERFTLVDGKAQPGFAMFLSKGMPYFAKMQLM